MIRVATTREELREMQRHWERIRRQTDTIRDAYERSKETRVRRRVGGTRAYADAVVLYFGHPPS